MGVSPVLRDHKELGAAFLCSTLLICLVLGFLVEFSPPQNIKRMLEHALVGADPLNVADVAGAGAGADAADVPDVAAADVLPVDVVTDLSASTSDQQPIDTIHPFVDSKQGSTVLASAPGDLDQLNPDASLDPVDQSSLAPLNHSAAAAPAAPASRVGDQPAAGIKSRVHDGSDHAAEKFTSATDFDITDYLNLSSSVQGLIRDIRVAALLSNGGEAVEPLDEDEKNEWNKRNPCMSREKLPLRYAVRKYAKDVEANPAWDAVFREYQILHRTCTRKVESMSQYFHARNTSSGCRFLVCDAHNPSGLGNKVLITVSCFLYAVLTQRVLLVPSSNILVTDVMCEPFEGSSWKVDQQTIGLPMASTPIWNTMQVFLAVLEASMDSEKRPMQNNVTVYATDVTDSQLAFHPDNRFFCPTEQTFLSNVTWLNLVGNQYFVAKLFGIPTFRTTLEALFPTRLVLTYLMRSLMLPGDAVWLQVEKVPAMQPDSADRRLGVQIRYLGGKEQFDLMHVVLERRIKRCALENGMLPHQAEDSVAANSRSLQSSISSTKSTSPHITAEQSFNNSSAAVHRTTVFIASLYDHFEKYLSSDYLQNPAANGENVTVVQLSNRRDQGFSIEEDVQALTEIILLSVSDDVIITPMSTFGILTQGYGGHKPWFMGMEFYEGPYPDCTEGQTIEGCYHVPDKYLSCPFDPELHDTYILDILPYVKDCLPADWPGGIQLMTS